MKLKFALPLLAALVAAACSEPAVPEVPDPVATPQPAETLRIDPSVRDLTDADATLVARRFARSFARPGRQVAATRSGAPEVIADADGNPFAYVVNFDEGGFCIVGASKDNYPVLAYDEHNTLTVEGNPSGIAEWIDWTVEAARCRTDEEQAAIALAWTDFEALPAAASSGYDDPARYAAFNAMMGSFDPLASSAFPLQFLLDEQGSQTHVPDDILRNARILADQKGCPYQYFIIERINRSEYFGPYIHTSWGQYDHNSLVIAEHPNCPTGCTAVAAGQIMNYYRYPEKYWNGESNLDQLLYDLGVSFNINYHPFDSGAEPAKMIAGLQTDFNYSVTQEAYTAQKMQVHLSDQEKPAMVGGFPPLSNAGHIWICDGYKNTVDTEYRMYYQVSKNGNWGYETNGVFYVSNSAGPVVSTPGAFFHTNWGWGGTGDGWYKYDEVLKGEIDGSSYDYSRNPQLITMRPNR